MWGRDLMLILVWFYFGGLRRTDIFFEVVFEILFENNFVDANVVGKKYHECPAIFSLVTVKSLKIGKNVNEIEVYNEDDEYVWKSRLSVVCGLIFFNSTVVPPCYQINDRKTIFVDVIV